MSTAGPGLTLRQIRQDDLSLLSEFVHGLSPATGYRRLLSGRTPTQEELRRWTAIDPLRECAIVALAREIGLERIVGVARYVMESPDDTDFAIVVADAWQRRGLGRELMRQLIEAARSHGIRTLSGMTLSTNHAMISLAREFGFRATHLPDASTRMLVLDM
jgi:GNAT superfamily N-acetyltransferase